MAMLPTRARKAGYRKAARSQMLQLVLLGLCLFSLPGCRRQRGTRLLAEKSSRGLTVTYHYVGNAAEPSGLTFSANGKTEEDLMLSGQPSPSVYPSAAGNSAEVDINYATDSKQIVEYRAGILSDNPSAGVVRVPRIEATVYNVAGGATSTAKYAYRLFGSAAVHDLQAVLDRISYYRADGTYAGVVIFEYAHDNYIKAGGVVTRTKYISVTAGGSEGFTRVTDYVWDGLPRAQRRRFLADFRPEGEMLTYSSLAKGNLKKMHVVTTSQTGQVTSDYDFAYTLTYSSNQLERIAGNGFEWTLSYETYWPSK